MTSLLNRELICGRFPALFGSPSGDFLVMSDLSYKISRQPIRCQSSALFHVTSQWAKLRNEDLIHFHDQRARKRDVNWQKRTVGYRQSHVYCSQLLNMWTFARGNVPTPHIKSLGIWHSFRTNNTRHHLTLQVVQLSSIFKFLCLCSALAWAHPNFVLYNVLRHRICDIRRFLIVQEYIRRLVRLKLKSIRQTMKNPYNPTELKFIKLYLKSANGGQWQIRKLEQRKLKLSTSLRNLFTLRLT